MASSDPGQLQPRPGENPSAGGPSPTVGQIRAGYAAFAEVTAEPEGVRWEDGTVGGVDGLWAVPENRHGTLVLEYLHGGGFIAGAPEYYRKLIGHLALAVGGSVFCVDYRLAPEYPFPAAVDDAIAVYEALAPKADGIEGGGEVALAGESAGGGLVFATLLGAAAAGISRPTGAVAMSPWVDLELTGASVVGRAELDPVASAEPMRGLASLYLDGSDPQDPLASPLYGDLTGLCPLYVQVGDHEILLDDSRRIVDKALASGVESRLEVFEGMHHGFQLAAGNLPEATEAVRRLGCWLRRDSADPLGPHEYLSDIVTGRIAAN